jgi:hypothetical protein
VSVDGPASSVALLVGVLVGLGLLALDGPPLLPLSLLLQATAAKATSIRSGIAKYALM